MAKKGYKPRITKQINNLSRAINKIDPKLGQRVMAVRHNIDDIRPGINDIKYMQNGIEKKVRYDEIAELPTSEQASLLNRLSEDRYNLRQQRALEQFKEKGKVSWQFKRSIERDNVKLLENIQELEELIGENKPEVIKEEFSGLNIQVGEDWFKEADSFFQLTDANGKRNTPELFDFYRPGEAGGFSELNAFTWNTYKVMKGIL